jgi:hypothetical protein
MSTNKGAKLGGASRSRQLTFCSYSDGGDENGFAESFMASVTKAGWSRELRSVMA